MRSYAFDKYIKPEYVQKFNKNNEELNFKDDYIETKFNNICCKFFAGKLYPKFTNLKQKIKKYQERIKKLNPELGVYKAREIVERNEQILKSYAKIKYCLDAISSGKYEVNVLAHLISIYYNLNRREYEKFKSAPLYYYLTTILKEFDELSLDAILDLDLSTLANNLFTEIELFDYAVHNLDLEDHMCWGGLIDMSSICHEIDDFEETQKVKTEINKKFEDKFYLDTHTTKNGLIF